jgi:hypothetical protein
MISALALLAIVLLGVSTTWLIVALGARQDRASALVALRRGPWRWRR